MEFHFFDNAFITLVPQLNLYLQYSLFLFIRISIERLSNVTNLFGGCPPLDIRSRHTATIIFDGSIPSTRGQSLPIIDPIISLQSWIPNKSCKMNFCLSKLMVPTERMLESSISISSSSSLCLTNPTSAEDSKELTYKKLLNFSRSASFSSISLHTFCIQFKDPL